MHSKYAENFKNNPNTSDNFTFQNVLGTATHWRGKKDSSNFQRQRSTYRLMHYQKKERWLLLCGIRHYIYL